MWAVRGVEGDVGEERFARNAAGVHPLDGLIEEEVGAIAFGLLELSVVPERWVNVGIVRRVATRSGKSLTDAAAAVDVNFVETTILWTISLLIAEMPFAENARGVAGGFEHLRERVGF